MGRLGGEVHGRGQDVGNIHGFGEHSPGNDAATSDNHHGRELTAELRDEVIDETIYLLPGDHFTTGLARFFWLHITLRSSRKNAGMGQQDEPETILS
jgi:hypothetical protein